MHNRGGARDVDTKKREEKEKPGWEKEKLVLPHSPHASAGLELTSLRKERNFDFKTKLYEYSTYLDIPVMEMKLFGRLKSPEIFLPGKQDS